MTKHLTHFVKHNFYPEPRHTGARMTKSLPGTIQKTKGPHATMDPDLRRGDAVLVPSNHNSYSSPMTNITHKPGIQTTPTPRHTGAGRYPLQATQPHKKEPCKKFPSRRGKPQGGGGKKIHQLGGWANMHRRKSGNTQCNIKTQPPS